MALFEITIHQAADPEVRLAVGRLEDSLDALAMRTRRIEEKIDALVSSQAQIDQLTRDLKARNDDLAEDVAAATDTLPKE